MLMERLRDRLERSPSCLRHEDRGNNDRHHGGAAEENVDAKGGFCEKYRCDERNEEVGNLYVMSNWLLDNEMALHCKASLVKV